MQKTIRILLYDEEDTLASELHKLLERYPEAELQIASHINDLIICLDDMQPHIIVVNDKISSYESLTALALLKRRRLGVPHVIMYDASHAIKELRNSGLGGFVQLIDEIKLFLDTIGDSNQAEMESFKKTTRNEMPLLAEIVKEFCDLVFILNEQGEISGWAKNEFSLLPAIRIGGTIVETLTMLMGRNEVLSILDSLQTNTPKEFEITCEDEGKRSYFAVRIFPIASGEKLLSLQDLTSIRQSESQLIHRNKLLETLPLGIILVNLDDKITYANHYAFSLCTRSRSDIYGKNLEESIPMLFPTENSFEIKQVLFAEGAWSGEIYIKLSDETQQLFQLRAMLQKSMHDKVNGIIYLFEPKEGRFAAQYQHIVENIAEGVFILSHDKVAFGNETLARMLGYSTFELTEQSIYHFIEKDDVALFAEKFMDITDRQESEHVFEVRLIHKNGINRIYAEIRLALMQYAEETVILGVARDVTERKMHEMLFESGGAEKDPNLLLTNQNLKDHDFRTFLNAIMGFADILRDRFREYYDDQNLFLYAERIFNSGQKMLQVLEENPSVTELAASRGGVTVESIAIQELVDECVARVEQAAENKNIKVSVVHNTKYCILGDRKRLLEVVLMLLENSVANTNAGYVLIDSGFDRLKNMPFIKIKDSSEGIDEQVLPFLFNPVVDNPLVLDDELHHTAEILTKAKRLVHVMNGRLEVLSSPAKGLTITLLFQLDERSAEDDQKSNIFYTVSPELLYLNDIRPHILIIEDDPGSSKMLEVTLKNISKLEFAANGHEAIQCIQQNHLRGMFFDLVLLDIGLPDPWNGITLRKHLIERFPEYQRIPFIAETAFVTRNEKEKIIESGFDGFISKPIDRRFLIKTLASTMRRIRGEQ